MATPPTDAATTISTVISVVFPVELKPPLVDASFSTVGVVEEDAIVVSVFVKVSVEDGELAVGEELVWDVC